MPYCVNCGVKLDDGQKKCPLCGVPVVLPEEIEKKPEAEPLFPIPDANAAKEYGKALSKGAKMTVEIVTSLMVIAEICCFFALFPHPSCWISMTSILAGYFLFLSIQMSVKLTYTNIATKIMCFVGLLVFAIDYFINGQISWSFPVISFMVLGWVGGVLPVMVKKIPTLPFIIAVASLFALFPLMDYFLGWTGWSLGVAYPIICFGAVLFFLIIIRTKIKKLIELTLTDIILLSSASVCFTVAFGDLVANGWEGITWSRMLWIIGLCIVVFEILRTSSKKIRNYFTANNS